MYKYKVFIKQILVHIVADSFFIKKNHCCYYLGITGYGSFGSTINSYIFGIYKINSPISTCLMIVHS